MSDHLVNWVIYERPSDYPDKFVVRRWELRGTEEIVPDQECRLADSLEEARGLIPDGLYCVGRFAQDDPCIVECWL
jgi:hypothetical protein